MMAGSTSLSAGNGISLLVRTSNPQGRRTPRSNEIGAHRLLSPTTMSATLSTTVTPGYRRPQVGGTFTSGSTLNFSLEELLNGQEQVVSYPDTSQYSQGGASACGLAAMNCVRLVLDLEHSGILENELLRRLTQKKFVEEIMSICTHWTSTSHLEIEDIFDTPFFKTYLQLQHSDYSTPEVATFERMLNKLGSQASSTNPYSRRCSALIITRPPEIIVCLRIPHRACTIYVVFDSHPRPKHPTGAAFIFNTSLKLTASYLASLLHVDARLLAEGAGLQWEAQLLGNVVGHVFTHSGANIQMSDATEGLMLESNMKLLKIKAEAMEVKERCNELRRENERLLKEVGELGEEKKRITKQKEEKERKENEERERERERERRGIRKISFSSTFFHAGFHAGSRPSRRESGGSSSPARPSGIQQLTTQPPQPAQPTQPTQSAQPTQPAQSAQPNQSAQPSQLAQPPRNPRLVSTRVFPLQGQGGSSPQTPRAPLLSNSPSDKPRVTDEALERSLRLAAQMQHEFSLEDDALRKQALQLTEFAPQTTFECSICMDEHPDDMLARIEKCKHAFCRDGLRDYITSRIRESRFPILCPNCTASTSVGANDAGAITFELIHQLGVSERDYQAYEEMELAGHSVMMHCRKCKRTSFVDKDEYQEAKVVFCPLPGCFYVWCKACQMPLPLNNGGADADEPEHSCDGSSELTHLMKQRGWKHCPGCKTPTEKIDGCNHMTCMTPSCNSHFCYVCGKLIVQSAMRKEIKEAVEKHYRACNLFEEIPDVAVPP